MENEYTGMSLDELIAELAGEKIEYQQEPIEVPMPGPVPGVNYDEKHKEMTRETAEAAGKQIAGLVVSGSEMLCGFIGKEKASKYSITAGQRRDLSEAYAEVAEYYGMGTTNPVFNAIMLTIIILSVPFKEAFSDRRVKKIEEEQQRQADELRRQNEELRMLAERQKIYEETQKGKVKENQENGEERA